MLVMDMLMNEMEVARARAGLYEASIHNQESYSRYMEQYQEYLKNYRVYKAITANYGAFTTTEQ